MTVRETHSGKRRDPYIDQHFYAYKNQYNGNPLLQITKSVYGAPQQENNDLSPSTAKILEVYTTRGILEMAKTAGIESSANTMSVVASRMMTTIARETGSKRFPSRRMMYFPWESLIGKVQVALEKAIDLIIVCVKRCFFFGPEHGYARV